MSRIVFFFFSELYDIENFGGQTTGVELVTFLINKKIKIKMLISCTAGHGNEKDANFIYNT